MSTQCEAELISAERLETICDDFIAVLNKRGIEYKKTTVEDYIKRWFEAKAHLIEGLSKHLGWSWDRLSIEFTIKSSVQIPLDAAVGDFVGNLKDLDLAVADILNELVMAVRDHDTTISTYAIGRINLSLEGYRDKLEKKIGRKVKVKARVGQTIPKFVNRLCTELGIDEHENYNKAFAKFSDSVYGRESEYFSYLSVHPIDYLLMSNGNSWRNCQVVNNLDENKKRVYGGCWQAGTLSYMCDGCTMVMYSTFNNVEKPCFEKKLLRQLILLSESSLVQSRLYPSSGSAAVVINAAYRRYLWDILGTCFGKPECVWNTLQDWSSINFIKPTTKVDYTYHYEDYRLQPHSCNYFGDKRYKDEENEMIVGSEVNCLICGKPLVGPVHLACTDCSKEVRDLWENEDDPDWEDDGYDDYYDDDPYYDDDDDW